MTSLHPCCIVSFVRGNGSLRKKGKNMSNIFVPLSEMDTSLVPEGTILPCRWFARCDREAVGAVTHPILEAVLVCERCAERATR